MEPMMPTSTGIMIPMQLGWKRLVLIRLPIYGSSAIHRQTGKRPVDGQSLYDENTTCAL